MLAKKPCNLPVNPQEIEQAEDFMLNLPQAECPVVHHFGPGIYIREVHLPSGVFALGHTQKYKHMNIVIKGHVVISDNNGNLKSIRGPCIFVGEPGRKFGYIVEDTVWQNVYATDETNIDTLESMFLDKSSSWKEFDDSSTIFTRTLREGDRSDFKSVLDEFGFTEEEVITVSENEDDQISMPPSYSAFITIRNSHIAGKGVFLSYPTPMGELIGPARIDGKRTPLGRYINHSSRPNARFVSDDSGDIWLQAIENIQGCLGGSMGDEVTIDYRYSLLARNQAGTL